jgi:hypothetical protein
MMKPIRIGWILAVVLGVWVGMMVPSCGRDDAEEVARETNNGRTL